MVAQTFLIKLFYFWTLGTIVLLAWGCGGSTSGGSTTVGNTAKESSSGGSTSTTSSPAGGSALGENTTKTGNTARGGTSGGSASTESTGQEGAGAGSEATTPQAAGSLSKAQFIKKADAICKSAASRYEREFSKYIKRNSTSSQTEQAQAAALVNSLVLPAYEKEITEVRALGAPSGDAAKVAAILGAMQRALDKSKSDPLTFLRSDNPFGKAPKLARAYGFTECGDV